MQSSPLNNSNQNYSKPYSLQLVSSFVKLLDLKKKVLAFNITIIELNISLCESTSIKT